MGKACIRLMGVPFMGTGGPGCRFSSGHDHLEGGRRGAGRELVKLGLGFSGHQ